MKYLYTVIAADEVDKGIKPFKRLFRSVYDAFEYRKIVYHQKGNIVQVYVSSDDDDDDEKKYYFMDEHDSDRIYSTEYINNSRVMNQIKRNEFALHYR